MIVFALTNKAREGTTGEVFLMRKEIVCHPGTIVFSLTIPIQFLPTSGMFHTHSSCVLERCLNFEMR